MQARIERDEGPGGALRILIRPNRSLSTRAMGVLLVAVTALVLTIGIGFTVVGAWLVLPFAGLEIAVVGAALLYLRRHADDCELLVIDEQRVWVVQRRGGKDEQHGFQRYWARVRLTGAGAGWYPSRLLIGSHGRFVEIGAAMNEEERRALAAHLAQALR